MPRTPVTINTPRTLHPDSSTASAHPVPPTRSPDGRSLARACWRAGWVSHRNTGSCRTPGRYAGGPTAHRSSRTPRTRGDVDTRLVGHGLVLVDVAAPRLPPRTLPAGWIRRVGGNLLVEQRRASAT